jgi:peptidoglycan/xylan/chitin deacetylase (PgdA/CDA1 family)
MIGRASKASPRQGRLPEPARVVAVLLAVVLLIVACGGPASPSPSASIGGSPSPSGPATSPTPTPSPSPSPSPTPVPSPTPIAHIVVAGDTLTSIARRYETTARSIAFWNRATYPSLDPDSPDYDPNTIQIGWTLAVWAGQVVDEQSPPPGPSATPRPSLSIAPSSTPVPGETSVVVDHGPRASNAVALTFDMGGRLDPAVDIVDWLVEHDVAATIFPTGSSATTTGVGRQVLQEVAAHPDLFSIGNHSWDHRDFRDLDATAIADQLTRTEEAIDSLVGRSTKPLFRPPFGGQDRETRDVVGRLGWSFTVLWDVDTIDWKPVADGGPTADDIVARVLARAQGGSIVLMHLGGYNTLAALPRIVDGLRDRGLEPVSLDRLLGTG